MNGAEGIVHRFVRLILGDTSNMRNGESGVANSSNTLCKPNPHLRLTKIDHTLRCFPDSFERRFRGPVASLAIRRRDLSKRHAGLHKLGGIK